jgi:hypothetical protein
MSFRSKAAGFSLCPHHPMSSSPGPAQGIRSIRRGLVGAAVVLPLAYLTRGSHFWSLAVAELAVAALVAAAAMDRASGPAVQAAGSEPAA